MHARQYAERAREHLRRHCPKLYRGLQAKGELEAYLSDLGREAEEMEIELERQYLERNPPPEDYPKRVNHLMHAHRIAEEITLHELILIPDEETERAIRRGGYRD